MGRRKVIDREATMKAIESVVRQHGLVGLSIDAVAKEAGISKSSVVYDFHSKNALLTAYIRNRMETKRAAIAEAAGQHTGQPNAWLSGLLDTIQDAPSEEDMATAMIVSAGMGNDCDCRALMAEVVREDLRTVTAQAADPRAAHLAYLAAYGLMSMEYFGFHHFSAQQRRQILKDIGGLVQAAPDPIEN